MRAVEAEIVAQAIDQGRARLDLERVGGAVDDEAQCAWDSSNASARARRRRRARPARRRRGGDSRVRHAGRTSARRRRARRAPRRAPASDRASCRSSWRSAAVEPERHVGDARRCRWRCACSGRRRRVRPAPRRRRRRNRCGARSLRRSRCRCGPARWGKRTLARQPSCGRAVVIGPTKKSRAAMLWSAPPAR